MNPIQLLLEVSVIRFFGSSQDMCTQCSKEENMEFRILYNKRWMQDDAYSFEWRGFSWKGLVTCQQKYWQVWDYIPKFLHFTYMFIALCSDTKGPIFYLLRLRAMILVKRWHMLVFGPCDIWSSVLLVDSRKNGK